MADVLPPSQSSAITAETAAEAPLDSLPTPPSKIEINDATIDTSIPPKSQNDTQPRISHLSRSSELSTAAPSTSVDYPASASSLSYALVRDFAYPPYHPLHYGADPEPSRPSTPTSDWNPERRRSDPMEPFNHIPSAHGGWSAGPWGGDGMMYDDPQADDGISSLPSTSFSGTGEAVQEFGEDEYALKRGKHRKSKSYGNISDFERGRRRESGRRSGADAGGIFYFQGEQRQQQGDARHYRGHSGTGNDINGAVRKDSPFAQTTLPNRSFHTSSTNDSAHYDDYDEDEQIPLDTEPHNGISPQRDSMGPEDEELFAGPSLALYSFEPENSNELRLDEGQEIMVSYRHGQGWLVASDPLTGEQGLVPEAYVRLIADMPNYDPERGEFVDMDEYEEVSAVEETTGEAVPVTPNDEHARWQQPDAESMPNATVDKTAHHEVKIDAVLSTTGQDGVAMDANSGMDGSAAS